MSLGGNTANFRWFYMLDDLIDIETDQEKAQQLKNCQVSLQKYPLVVHKPDELRVLQHFKNDIVDKLQARFAQEQSFFVQKAFSQVRVEDPDSEHPSQSLGDISGSGSKNGQKPAQKMEEAGGSRPTKAKEPPKKKTQVRNILLSRLCENSLADFCTSALLKAWPSAFFKVKKVDFTLDF